MTPASSTHSRPRIAVTILLAVAALVAGYIAGRFAPNSLPGGQVTEEQAVPVSPVDTIDQQEQLAALGYTAGSVPAPAKSGVTVHNTGAAYASYNLLTSGHLPGALLMTMDGQELHRWEYSFEKLWPGKDPGEDDVSFWRRVHLFENGDILGIIEPIGIFRLNRDSKLLWENDCGAHHDFYVADNGHIFTLARKSKQLGSVLGVERPVLEDFVIELDENGVELRRVSILDALDGSDYRPLLHDAPAYWDITHTNSLKFLGPNTPTRVPAFQPGRFLLSLRELDSIAILDFDRARIEWAIKGMWRRQHEATLLDSGNLLLFDNLAGDHKSRVLEVDPATQAIAWSYGSTPEQSVFSAVCGLAKRLPNGNTLITESVPGRVIEVAPDHTIAWEFVNPHRAKKSGDLIASIFDFQRLPQDFVPSWLGQGSSAPAHSGAD